MKTKPILTVRALKTYSCDKCGCNIEKGTQYVKSRVWSKGHYDDDLEWCNGYMATLHEHAYGIQCDVAIQKVQDEFYKVGKQ